MTDTYVARDTRPVMGGEATITIVGGTREMLDDAFAVAQRCDDDWSRFRADSDISRINALAPSPVVVSPLTIALVAEMREGFVVSGGDFNPTMLPALLDVGYERSQVTPSLHTQLPAGKRTYATLDDVHITDSTVAIPGDMTLDSGGIGKGFAADLITAAIMGSGARGTMVSLSGDIVVAGEAPDGGPWRIGIEDPFTNEGHIHVARLVEGAVVTSSQRKNRFAGGHHLIDPKTGHSARTRVQTATVIAMSGSRAEVLAKSGFLREPEVYLEWLPTLGAAGMLVLEDASELYSENWSDYAQQTRA